MTWLPLLPIDSGLLINAPGYIRANWEALELMTDADLLITNAKVAAGAAIVDTKLAQITTASKVHGSAITGLASTPAGAGNLPADNLGNACKATTNQTIAGIKTFSSFPVTPSAACTTDYQVANKKYVDDKGSIVVIEEVVAMATAVDKNIPEDDTLPQFSEGETFMSKAHTPDAATNRVEVTVIAHFAHSANGKFCVALYKDGASNADAVGCAGTYLASNTFFPFVFTVVFDTIDTTDEIIFTVRAGNNTNGTTTFNGKSGARLYGGAAKSMIIIKEYT